MYVCLAVVKNHLCQRVACKDLLHGQMLPRPARVWVCHVVYTLFEGLFLVHAKDKINLLNLILAPNLECVVSFIWNSFLFCFVFCFISQKRIAPLRSLEEGPWDPDCSPGAALQQPTAPSVPVESNEENQFLLRASIKWLYVQIDPVVTASLLFQPCYFNSLLCEKNFSVTSSEGIFYSSSYHSPITLELNDIIPV